MAGLRFQNPAPQFRDLDDDVAVGGRLYFYESGTLTPAETYSDEDLAVPNPNPVELDAFGRSETSIFLDPSVAYRCVLKDADLQVIWDRDPLSGSDIAAAIAAHNADPNAHLDATESQRGMVELANSLEAKEGTEPLKVMTPATTKALLQDPGYVLNTRQGTAIASAASINLETATGNTVDVTGTTGITAVTLDEGHVRTVRFTGALTLTNSGTLVLPGGKNITTAAGDYATFVGAASDVVRVITYTRANAQSLAGSSPNLLMIGALSTSGDTSIAIPSGLTTMDRFRLTIAMPPGASGNFVAWARFNNDTGSNYNYVNSVMTEGAGNVESSANLQSAFALSSKGSIAGTTWPMDSEIIFFRPLTTRIRTGWVRTLDVNSGGPALRHTVGSWTNSSTAVVASIQILLRDATGDSPTGAVINAPANSFYALWGDPASI